MSAAAKDGEPRHEVRSKWAGGGTDRRGGVLAHDRTTPCFAGRALALAPHERTGARSRATTEQAGGARHNTQLRARREPLGARDRESELKRMARNAMLC